MKKSQKQAIFSTIHSQEIVLLVLYVLQIEMTDLPSFHTLQRVKSLTFHIPDAWKRYPFQAAEPSRIGHHYRESPQAQNR